MGASVALKTQETPRRKLYSRGVSALSDIELLQAVIGSGGQGNDFRQISKKLNAAIQKIGADKLTIEDVKEIKGIGDAKASTLFASLEFWQRKFTQQPDPLIDTPEKAAEQLHFIRDKKQEYFVALTLNGARRLINCHIISIGTLMSSLVHPREIFSTAIEDRAASIIIAHNHPSGILDISAQDKEVTTRIKLAGELLGITLDDHIIVTKDGFVSAY